jgi:hypothetical protein
MATRLCGFHGKSIHVSEVQRYISRQKEHHRKEVFRDEFIRFLKVNQIEFDERYV